VRPFGGTATFVVPAENTVLGRCFLGSADSRENVGDNAVPMVGAADHANSHDERPEPMSVRRDRAAGVSEGVLRRTVVAEALSSLSLAHREVLTETIMRRRSVNEAADVLGIPLDTVKVRVYYALRALRIVLEERGVAT
jgi:DNA-directed RNA polymerase specialized sigma24 family protein